MRWIRGAAAWAVGLWFASALALDRYGATSVPRGTYDAVVVAGAGVRPGGVPSATLVRRTHKGAGLVLADVAPRLALTGGVGDWGPAEAIVAAELARNFGVSPDRIVMETRSRNTEGNAFAIREVLGEARVLVVTDHYHAFRCRRVFARYFADVDVVGVRGALVPRVWGALREVAAVGWYGWTGRLGPRS